jgi:hypothetical protein
MMTTHKSLATVIGSPDLDQIHEMEFRQWSGNYLRSDDLFSLLHAKFWGTSMEEEERQWRASQPTAGDDEDGRNNNTEEEDDDNIIPGCYLLDLTLGGSLLDQPLPLKIWVRADYKRIYDYVEYHYNNKSHLPYQAPAVVVTGQPGIGA